MNPFALLKNLPNPLDLFKSIKTAVITAAVIAAITFVGVLWLQKRSAEADLLAANVQLATLKDDLFKAQATATGLKVVIATLETTNATLGEQIRTETATDKDIDNAPPEDDAPLAPVLRRTLDSVDRMLHHAN
jgi:hypothetical protein